MGRVLVAARIAKGWSQRRLAKELAISPAAICKAEREEYEGVTAERAQRILDALGVEIHVSAQFKEPSAARGTVTRSLVPGREQWAASSAAPLAETSVGS